MRNNDELEGKKILFFGPKTFNYETAIKEELEGFGASVTYCSDKPFRSLILIVLLRLKPKWAWPLADTVYKSWLKIHGPKDCDIVFIIKGEGLSPKFIHLLQLKYKDAKFILYLWDSVSNIKNIEEKFKYFSSIYSFDPADCERFSVLNYRPLFFLNKYLNQHTNSGDGVFFIGTLNGDRSRVISKLVSFLPKTERFEYWLFVRSRIEFFIRKLFNFGLYNLDHSRLLRSSMSIDDINTQIALSSAVLDIEHPKQNGLTMRTFEVLASGKKLITTNMNIVSHDFFDPSRICVIDRKIPTLSKAFFETSVKPLPEFFTIKYSLRGWLLDVLK